jgi:glycolate oxidase FAD binding subunit
MTVFSPSRAEDVLAAVQWAVGEDAPLEILGHGTKRGIGRPVQSEHTLDLSDLSGVTLYEPEELVLSARAGTPVAEIEALLVEKRQQLAFEPLDYGPLFGAPAGRGTLENRRKKFSVVLAASSSGVRPSVSARTAAVWATKAGSLRLPRCGGGAR